MDKIQMIYDLLKEARADIGDIKDRQEADHSILEEHRRCSEANSQRLRILEQRALFINWKLMATLAGILSSLGGLSYYLFRIFGK